MENKPRKSSTAYIAICVKYACKNVLLGLDFDALEIIILGGGPVDARNLTHKISVPHPRLMTAGKNYRGIQA